MVGRWIKRKRKEKKKKIFLKFFVLIFYIINNTFKIVYNNFIISLVVKLLEIVLGPKKLYMCIYVCVYIYNYNLGLKKLLLDDYF